VDIIKNPNGFGSVIKLSGNRRRPFAARKTLGFDDRGYPMYDVIGYTKTKEEGLILLARDIIDKYEAQGSNITFGELHELWKEKKAPKLGASNKSSLKSAYNHCSALFDMKYREIKSFHMQDIIDNCGKGYSTQAAIRSLFKHLDAFAFETDVISKMYSELTTSDPIPETSKTPFTDKEVAKIWKFKDEPWIDSVLIFLYTGFRISELLDIRTANVDLIQGTIKGGRKTRAGKDRIVPIHSKILPLVMNRLSEGKEYLFTYNGKKMSTSQYYIFWDEIMEHLKMEHKTHECRHTLRSRLDSAGANKKCIDLIMGHKSKEVGERVYTHKTIQELKDTIELLEVVEKVEKSDETIEATDDLTRNYLTAREFAFNCGVSRKDVYTWINNKLLPDAIKVGRDWQIPLSATKPTKQPKSATRPNDKRKERYN